MTKSEKFNYLYVDYIVKDDKPIPAKVWKQLIDNATNTQQLDEIAEHMSFCDDISHHEYYELYDYALDLYHEMLES